MSTSIDIPGGRAILRDQNELKQRHRRDIELAALAAQGVFTKLTAAGFDPAAPDAAAFSKVTLSRSEWAATLELQDATILAFLQEWTLPVPLPTWDTLGDLDTDVYDALKEATAKLGAGTAVLAVDFAPSDPTAPGFSETPTSDSASSDSNSKDEPESEPTPMSSTDGESIDIAPYTLA